MANLVLPLNWQHLGWTPTILGDDGKVLQAALQYAVRGKRKQKSYTTLYRQALAISRMSDLWQMLGDDVGNQEILGCYFEALVHGDEELGWSGMDTTTAGQYLKYLNEFFDWWALETNQPSPNPIQEERIGWLSILTEQKRQYGTNMLAHLLPATVSGQGRRESRTIQPDQVARHNARSQGRPKAMDLLDYLKLVREDPEPRNRALWLALGAGGRRISEVMHIFVPDDIGFFPRTGEANIRIADPRYGKIEVIENGEARLVTRQEYLRKHHRMIPRVLARPGSGVHAGWKGIREQDTRAKSKDIIWMAPQFGKLMWETHKEYMKQREATGAEHPFYFVNTKRNKGAPLTISNAKGLLRDACKRLGISSRTNLHSLRHVYGNFLACELEIQAHLITLAFGHRSLASASAYTQPTQQQLRNAINKAQENRKPLLTLPD